MQLLRDICILITDGDHSATQYTDEGVLYLLSESVKEGYIDTTIKRYISPELHSSLQRSQLKAGDVLLTKTGVYFGKSSVVPDGFPEANTSAHVGRFVVRTDIINPYYLSAFFNSKYGYSQLRRRGIKASRPEVKLIEFNDIKVVVLDKEFQEKIERISKQMLNALDKSKSIFEEAKILLLSELGFLNWKPNHQLNFVKNYSDTQQAGRFDAEYFQPKYDEIVAAIKNHARGWDTLSNLVSLKKCIEVGSEEYSDEGIPFIRVSNLSPFEITEEKYISEKLYSELTPKEESDVTFEESKNHQPKKDEILFSKDATPGIAYFLGEEPEKMIPSGGILRLKLKDKRINPSYLTLVLNSLIVQEQINRDVGGSVILHWRPEQVKETLIPILKEDKQDEIQQKISESFNLRKQSKHQLECAKKAVEIAIEKDEETAMQWINSQLDA